MTENANTKAGGPERFKLTGPSLFASSLVPIEIKMADGRIGEAFLKPLKTADVLSFYAEGTTTEFDPGRMQPLIAKSIVDEDGEPLFDEVSAKRMEEVDAYVYMALVKHVTQGLTMGDDEGNASSGTPDSASPSD